MAAVDGEGTVLNLGVVTGEEAALGYGVIDGLGPAEADDVYFDMLEDRERSPEARALMSEDHPVAAGRSVDPGEIGRGACLHRVAGVDQAAHRTVRIAARRGLPDLHLCRGRIARQTDWR